MSNDDTSIGFIGLGSMGLALAERLVRQGFVVTGFDRDPARAKRLHGGEGNTAAADSLGDVVARSRCIITCLPSADAVQQVYDGLAAILRPGQLTIDVSTVPPELAIATSRRVSARGGRHVEMPVVGTVQHAADGALHLLISADGVGGTVDLPGPVTQVMAAISRSQTFAGPPGGASLFKIIQNGLGLVQLNAIAEAIGVCAAAGLSPQAFVDFVATAPGMANSVLFHRTAHLMIAPEVTDVTARLAIAAKDAELYGEVARHHGARSDLCGVSAALLDEAAARGLADADFTRVAEIFLRP
jgi:3-hydroxyisobutyrate dehydrogenase-like beta-hydroxyacid dehydrogenase